MSTQVRYPTTAFDQLTESEPLAQSATRTPTAQEMLEAMMGAGTTASTSATNGAAAKRYRGRTTAELIPKIQADLGPQAIVTKRRSGLEGGIGGFFQRPFVEIEAHEGRAGVDIRDGEDALPPPLEPQRSAGAQAPLREDFVREPPMAFAPAPAIQPTQLDAPTYEPPSAPSAPSFAATLTGFAPVPHTPTLAPASFAAALEDAEAPSIKPAPRSVQAKPSRAGAALSDELVAKGFSDAFVGALLEEAAAHVLPFSPRIGRRRAVRIALERRIPEAEPLRGGGAAIAFVGPGGVGKTACQTALATRYQQGTLPVARAALALDAQGAPQLIAPSLVNAPVPAQSKRARDAIEGARKEGVALLDTLAFSPADGAGTKALAQLLGTLALDRLVLVAPATMSASALAGLLRASSPLAPSALALTHVEESEQLGTAIEAACEFRVAPEYLLSAARGGLALTRTDRSAIASTLLP